MATIHYSMSVEDCCWAAGGWDEAGEGTVRDATKVTRGRAAAFVAGEATGDIRDVRVWKRYIRLFSNDEIWQRSSVSQECWAEAEFAEGNYATLDLATAAIPTTAPPGYEGDEYDAAWEFVHRTHPEARPVWVVGFKGDEPPANPPAVVFPEPKETT